MTVSAVASRRDVVVTGIGPVTSVGIGVEAFWSSLVAGRSGIGRIIGFDGVDLDEYPARIAGQVLDFNPAERLTKWQQRRYARFSQYGYVAAELAMTDAKFRPEHASPDRVGVIMGTGIGGFGVVEGQHENYLKHGPRRIIPELIPLMMPNAASAVIAIAFGFRGPNEAVSTACASSGNALARAADLIRYGVCDVVIAGGTESLVSPMGLATFNAARAVSTRNDEPERASRPFDAGRDGFVMADGAAVLVLEEERFARARGASPLARLAGYALTEDAYNLTAPHPDSLGACLAMEKAIADAGLTTADIGYINAHATSTRMGDQAEARAVRKVFGHDAPPTSSTKSMTGHALGAAGAIEAAVSVLAITEGVLPPTINQDSPDPDIDLDVVPNVARQARTEASLSNTFGFGGQNAALVFTRA